MYNFTFGRTNEPDIFALFVDFSMLIHKKKFLLSFKVTMSNSGKTKVTIKVRDGINNWLDNHGCSSVSEIIGALED